MLRFDDVYHKIYEHQKSLSQSRQTVGCQKSAKDKSVSSQTSVLSSFEVYCVSADVLL